VYQLELAFSLNAYHGAFVKEKINLSWHLTEVLCMWYNGRMAFSTDKGPLAPLGGFDVFLGGWHSFC